MAVLRLKRESELDSSDQSQALVRKIGHSGQLFACTPQLPNLGHDADVVGDSKVDTGVQFEANARADIGEVAPALAGVVQAQDVESRTGTQKRSYREAIEQIYVAAHEQRYGQVLEARRIVC